MQCPDEHTASERENITEKKTKCKCQLKTVPCFEVKPQELVSALTAADPEVLCDVLKFEDLKKHQKFI